MTAQPRRFHLARDRDISGVSGTGIVALGVLWPDGAAAVRWLGDRPSTVHWDRFEDAVAVHGHGGATRIVWLDDEERADDTGDPAELRDLPREVRHLVHTVDRLRSDWAESSDERRTALWRDLHEASDTVWNRPTADRGDLRDRIAHALAADDGHPWDTLGLDTQQSYLDNAAAVLAVVTKETASAERFIERLTATVVRLRAERTELIRQRDQVAMDTIKALPAPANRAAGLTAAERQFLTFALDQAADQMASCGDEFTGDDEAALKRFRRMAAGGSAS